MTNILSKDTYSQSVEKQCQKLVIVLIYITFHVIFCSELILEPRNLFNMAIYPKTQTNTKPIATSSAPAL